MSDEAATRCMVLQPTDGRLALGAFAVGIHRWDASYQGIGDWGRSRQDQGGPSGWASQQRNLGDYAGQRGQHHDPDYHQWREQQLRNLDDDYQSWRGEHYKKFSDEFSEWRKNRSTQDTGSANKRSTASGTGSSSGTSSTSVGTGSGSGNSGTSGSK